jgi:long-chain acyl-CoA synthetase
MTMTATATGRETLCDLFAISATERGMQGALRTTDGALALSWSDYGERVRAAAAGLAGLGVGHGETVACWLTNRPEFHVADAAALHLGAAPFSIYPTFTAEQAEHVVGDAGARVIVTEPQFLERAHAVRDGRRTRLETIVLVDGADARALTWGELEACARKGFDLAAASRAIGPDDLATLIYTSGTTGPPKGVELTHRNIVSLLDAFDDRLEFPTGARAISWLPMAHIAERLCTHYFPMARGWEVTACAQPRAVADVVRQVRPGVFFSPPRLWEKLRAGVLAGTDEAMRSEIESAVDRVRAGDGIQDGALASAVRARLGFDELAVAIVGAAPCPADVIEFWHALGVPLGEVYGMSETTGVATANAPLANRIGTAGTALRGVEVRLSGEGEILVRGSVVSPGSGPSRRTAALTRPASRPGAGRPSRCRSRAGAPARG